MQQRTNELDFLLHAAREFVHLRVSPVFAIRAQLHALEPHVDLGVERLAAHAFEFAQKFEHAADLHLLVQPALFW